LNTAIASVATLFCFTVTPFALAGPVDSSPFPLVDGARQAVIVSGEQGAQDRLGWSYRGDVEIQVVRGVGGGATLQTWIEKSTGRKLQVLPEKQFASANAAYPIFVGSTAKARELFGDKLKTLDSDGYIVCVTPDYVVLAGNVDYAEHDFLRTYLGVDSYLPVKLFTVVPPHERVLIPVDTRIELPVFFSRAFSGLRAETGLNNPPELHWRLHPGVGNGRYKFHHNIHQFITVAEFGTKPPTTDHRPPTSDLRSPLPAPRSSYHPEYFPLIGGQRLVVSGSDKPGPCLSNPEVVQIIIKKCREHFDKNPEALCISLGMPDVGQDKWCECSNCRAMDGTSLKVGGATSRFSNRYYTFLNQVAKALRESHPGKSVGTLGYLGTDRPPSFPLERNIIVYLCASRANWCVPANKANDLELIDAWLERIDHVGIYEYLYGMGFSIPRLYTRALAEYLRHVGNKRPGSGFYAEIYSNHGLDGPKPWLVEKLLWNPNQDVDALMTQWATACFGPASEPMKKYFDLLEEDWMRNGARVKPTGILWGYRQEIQYEMLRPEDLPPLWKLLEEAKAKAGADETVLKRIDYFAATFKVSDVMARRYHAYAEAARLMASTAAPAQVLASLVRHTPEAPAFDLEGYLANEVWAKLPAAFTGDGQPKRDMRAIHYILDAGPWQSLHDRLQAGERNPTNLVRQAQATLTKLAPAGYEKNPAARTLVNNLLSQVDRVALARRVTQSPVIDGQPDEACWTWVDQNPWSLLNSINTAAYRTQFAWAYDDENLYLALRCFDQAAGHVEGLNPKGAAWMFPSIELEIAPSPAVSSQWSVVSGQSAAPYQMVLSMADGVWEGKTKALASHKTAPAGPETWQAELAFNWKLLGVDPHQTAALRINLQRNIRTRYVPGVSTWYATFKPDKGAPLPPLPRLAGAPAAGCEVTGQ
jgi:hypothetical protein